MNTTSWLTYTVLLVTGLVLGYFLRLWLTRRATHLAENNIDALLSNARREAEAIVREGTLHAKDELLKTREQVENENQMRRQEIKEGEERLLQRENVLDRKLQSLDKKDEVIERKTAELETLRQTLAEETNQAESFLQKQKNKLLEISGMSQEEAKDEYMQTLEGELKAESAALIRRTQKEMHETSEREARKIIALAVERFAADQINEMTTCSVALPNDEMKGRIIGKEGRNIRAIEAATGVNILIDDTPEVVVISGFDPLRREIARQSMEQLINDGRIHPSRIEEVVNKVKAEIDAIIEKSGQQAIYELGLQNIDPTVVSMIGRLKYRHSYGQNVLKHSIEMGHLMGMMASELGLEPAVAKRVGLLHDIGKAMDHDVEGSHAIIGADFIKKHGETPLVVNAVAAHHDEVEAESTYAILARAGDAMTAARPGARSENTEIYLKRLEKLEEIATSYRGVDKSFAIQAGREVRVFVEPKSIDDNEALLIARNISQQIEQDVKYPGQIKVTVVRETRCVEYAK